ncbi:sigma-70 family RNA polymerase sigma factor [Natronogracilivirga saccharolytica]|uniref:Sigma-70 family RNA polymerase sigma factor n=1 Tax=Natronogracilivirga saccharolytica TaxID=2812953 RepID=A0A8J7SA23_9BACT|nr:sigma-70 family RNA polymerase sigma factor [Natronogracilivirga saccharolytica]MBP3193208.1 sigma-70 family RNA polymerase sigma factor [Natronogracilivirga saccharolytica]
MSASSSDYSNLIEAVLRDDRKTANMLSSDLMKKVILYLKVRMGAPQSIAEECAYQAFSDVFEVIRNDKITDRKSVFKYLLTASRNEYLRYVKSEKRADVDLLEKQDVIPEPASQLENLIDEERQKKLKICLEKLAPDHKRFIMNFFSVKNINLMEMGEKFGFSYAKTRTLKTRIMKELHHCVQNER